MDREMMWIDLIAGYIVLLILSVACIGVWDWLRRRRGTAKERRARRRMRKETPRAYEVSKWAAECRRRSAFDMAFACDKLEIFLYDTEQLKPPSPIAWTCRFGNLFDRACELVKAEEHSSQVRQVGRKDVWEKLYKTAIPGVFLARGWVDGKLTGERRLVWLNLKKK